MGLAGDPTFCSFCCCSSLLIPVADPPLRTLAPSRRQDLEFCYNPPIPPRVSWKQAGRVS